MRELEKLEKLSCIEIDNKDEFLTKLGDVIEFIGQLKNLNISKDPTLKQDNNVVLKAGVNRFGDTEAILNNVQHDKVNNAISINKI